MKRTVLVLALALAFLLALTAPAYAAPMNVGARAETAVVRGSPATAPIIIIAAYMFAMGLITASGSGYAFAMSRMKADIHSGERSLFANLARGAPRVLQSVIHFFGDMPDRGDYHSMPFADSEGTPGAVFSVGVPDGGWNFVAA